MKNKQKQKPESSALGIGQWCGHKSSNELLDLGASSSTPGNHLS